MGKEAHRPVLVSRSPFRPLLMRVIALALTLALGGLPLLSADPALAAEAAQSEPPSEWGISAAAWVLTVPYGAAKVAYAIVGGTIGVLTFAFSGGNKDAAMSVWTTSMGGNYIITPDHLKGREPLRLTGGQAEGPKPPAPRASLR